MVNFVWSVMACSPVREYKRVVRTYGGSAFIVRDPYNQLKVKVRLSHSKSWRLRWGMEFWASVITLTFGVARAVLLSAVRADRTLPPRKFLGSHFVRG